MSKSKVIEAIEKHNKFLIVSHIDLEGDSIGSQFAFKILLEKLGKTGVVVNEGRPTSQYDFLEVTENIITDLNVDIDYEAIVILDCPSIERIGRARSFLGKSATLINIDHHISNVNFGDINWVEPYVGSCGEMVYELYKALNMPIDYKCALFLYVAILTDTGSFAYENTYSSTHNIAAELISKGLKPGLIYQILYENKTLSEIGLLKDALSTLRLTKDGRVAYMYVSKKMFDRLDLGLGVTESFINFARSIKKADVAIIFLEDPVEKRQIEISFRSKGEVNVNKLASLFGGGGHKNASGCIMKGRLKPVMRKVLNMVKQNI